jgi:hypothetical protein
LFKSSILMKNPVKNKYLTKWTDTFSISHAYTQKLLDPQCLDVFPEKKNKNANFQPNI